MNTYFGGGVGLQDLLDHMNSATDCTTLFFASKRKHPKFTTVMGSFYLTLLITKTSPSYRPLLVTTFLQIP